MVRAAVMEKKMTKYTPCYKNSDHISSRYFVGLLLLLFFFLMGGGKQGTWPILANARRNLIMILFHGRKLNIDEL